MTIYERLGVTSIINASGPVTRLGGAPMTALTIEAMVDACREAVSVEQLQGVASSRIAAVTGTEAGLVTSGAAAALTLGAAAILARDDLARMERLPQCGDFPHEFIVARDQRNGYDHAVRAAGGVLVEVGLNEITAGSGVRRVEAWEYAAAIGPQSAGVLYVYSDQAAPPLVQVVDMAHTRHLPVLVDAAGELPPRSNLRALAATGADLVAFSGGKAIAGPQGTGILCGARNFIESAALQMLDMDDHFELWDPPATLIDKRRFPALPRHGLGRGFKVAKEQIVGLLVALEQFCEPATSAVQEAGSLLEEIQSSILDLPLVVVWQDSTCSERPPRLILTLTSESNRAALDLCRRLRAGTPPIYLGHGRLHANQLVLDPTCLRMAHAAEIIRRLREELL